MKKIITTIAMVLTLTVCAFASDEKINPDVLSAFQSKFTNAQEITWKENTDHYKVTFVYHGYRMCAYYDAKAELLGVTRFISSTHLPLYLQNILEKNYASYWITDLFELSNANGFSYYLTLQNAEQKIILKSQYGGDWEVYQKQNL